MGIYYQAMDHINKEIIKPPGAFSIKFPGIFYPTNPFPNIVIMANALGSNFEIVNDGYENIYYDEGYKDRTDYYFNLLKEYYPEYDWHKARWKKDQP
jgi:hypothetical protein